MADVSYSAGTSRAHNEEPIEASVEIIDPKVNTSFMSSDNEENGLNKKKLSDSGNDEKKSNRPSSSLLRQQKLPAWQPILTSDTVLPALFLLGIALIPIGVGLLLSSNYVQELSFEYTDCFSRDGKTKCSDVITSAKNITKGKSKNKIIWAKSTTKCECWHNFTLTEEFKAPVFLYYGLSKFYQNHRRYVQSKDDNQLYGKGNKVLSKFCEPYKEFNGNPVAPCGAIANSLFNDTFKLFLIDPGLTGSIIPIDLAQTGIAWPTDKAHKYKNPENFPSMEDHKASNPPYWGNTRLDDLDPYNPDNNGYKNEHLIIWLRTAAFPTFRKLWGRIDHDQSILWRTALPKGHYLIKIDYKYPVKSGDWNGGKHIYISNTSWLGGKNNFLGYAYIVVGAICLLLWVVFLIIVKKFGQKPKDIVDIGRKTAFVFALTKTRDLSDDCTQPLRAMNAQNSS